MAITATSLTSGGDSTDSTSYNTASITPSSNKLIVIAVVNRRVSGSASEPTVSGCGLTWEVVDATNYTQLFDELSGTYRGRVSVLRSMGTPTTGALTISFSGVTQLSCGWSVVEFDGVDTSGSNGSGAIVQTARNSSAGTGTVTVTLSSFSSASNGAYSAFGSEDNTAINPDSGWTEIHDGGTSAPSSRVETQWRADNDTTAVGTSSSGTPDMGGIAVELKAASSSASIPVIMNHYRQQGQI